MEIDGTIHQVLLHQYGALVSSNEIIFINLQDSSQKLRLHFLSFCIYYSLWSHGFIAVGEGTWCSPPWMSLLFFCVFASLCICKDSWDVTRLCHQVNKHLQVWWKYSVLQKGWFTDLGVWGVPTEKTEVMLRFKPCWCQEVCPVWSWRSCNRVQVIQDRLFASVWPMLDYLHSGATTNLRRWSEDDEDKTELGSKGLFNLIKEFFKYCPFISSLSGTLSKY